LTVSCHYEIETQHSTLSSVGQSLLQTYWLTNKLCATDFSQAVGYYLYDQEILCYRTWKYITMVTKQSIIPYFNKI